MDYSKNGKRDGTTMYITAGQFILQDGPKPNFIEKALVDRLVEGSCTTQRMAREGTTMYITAGQCILQDGPKPNFLEKALVDRLVEGSCTTQRMAREGTTRYFADIVAPPPQTKRETCTLVYLLLYLQDGTKGDLL